MPVPDKRRIIAAALVLLLTLVGLSGCGRIGNAPAPVSGSVFYNGAPLPFARIVFSPQEITGRTVVTVTNIRGRFEVMDGETLGLPPGQYSVTISYYLTASNIPGRPETTVDFDPENWTQLLPDKYSDKSSTSLSALIVPFAPEGDNQQNIIHFKLEGDDIVLPSRARQPGGRSPAVAVAPPGDVRSPPVRRGTSGNIFSSLIVYGGGALLILAVVAVTFRLIRRKIPSGEEGASPYQYEGEMDEPADQNEADQAPPEPRKRRKRRKKRVRERDAQQELESAETGTEPIAEAPPPTAESAAKSTAESSDAFMQGSPFPVLDEGMNDDDLAAALIAGEESGSFEKEADLEIAAAEWVLGMGGMIKIQEPGAQPRNVKDREELPSGEFQIQGLFFEKVDDLTDERLEEIGELPHLDTLDLASTGITDQGLGVLTRLPGLKTLALSRTAVTDAGLAIVAELPAINVLLLYRTQVTDAGIAHLKKMSHLKTVELKRTEISEAGIKELREFLPKCNVIA